MRQDSPIFVGSSKEKQGLAKQIVEELQNGKFQVLPWWGKQVFRAGDVTLDRLVQLSQICGAAVLVFGGDDKTWSRGRIKMSVRDNVLLEYGLFLAGCQRERTVIVAEEGVRLPTDVDGLTIVFFKKRDTQKETAETVARHFRRLVDEPEFQPKASVVLHVDWFMHLHTIEPADQWSPASLYHGRKGALAWRAVELDSAYAARVQTSETGAQIGQLISDRPVNTVVSLGPGAGTVDVEVMANFRTNRLREYIPVDVNQYLLLESARRVVQHNALTKCVRGILCDFDTNASFVGEIVREHGRGPTLFLMAGGTFGNSIQTEAALLRSLHAIMNAGDLFVFDLFCWTSKYVAKKDPLYNLGKSPLAVQEFFANGVRTICRRESLRREEALKRLEVQETAGGGLPGTKAIAIVEKTSNSTLVRIRRFSLKEISVAIKDAGFKIVSPKKVSTGVLERHILLARK